MDWYPAALVRLSIPVVLVGAALYGRSFLTDVSGEASVLLAYLPYVLCLLALFTAYQFNRVRLALVAVAVGLFYWAVQAHLQVSLSEDEAAAHYLGFSLALPLATLYLLVVPERGLLSLTGVYTVIGFAALLGAVLYLGPLLASLNAGAVSYYAPWPAEGYVMSLGASLLSLVVLLGGLALVVLRQDETDAAVLGVFMALFAALAQLHLAQVSLAMSLAASLCLVWGVLRSSHAMAYRDELTGIPGRRALNERLKTLGRRYAVGMVDVDHFKRFNDTHGHDVGDEVLRLVASRIRHVRGGTAYRYGGEEFCVVFPRGELEDCAAALDEIREEIANYRMSIRDRALRPSRPREGSRRRGATRLRSDQVSVTVSAGLAERTERRGDPESVIKAADQKLYQAKKGGRNRVAW